MANPTELSSIFSTLIKEINEAGQSDVLKGSVGSIKALSEVIKEQDKLIEKTLRAGDERAAMRILKSAKQAQEAQVEATNNLREAKERLAKLDQEGNTKGREAQLKVIGKINQEINRLAREAKLMQKNATEFSKGAEYSLTQYQRVLENREERIKELGKTGAMIEEKFSNRFEASVNAFTSGVGDLESFGDTFAGGLKSLGSYLMERKGKAEEKALAGKGDMGIANALGGLSKMVSTMAVIGGSIMMLIKLFKFVEGTVIEANKALLEGGVAINDLYNVGLGDTQKNLEAVRDTFRDSDFANAMGIPLEDTMALVAGFNQLNMGIKQFGGGKEGMEAMKRAMKDTKGMAFGLGISMDEAQQYMAKFTHDLGVSAKDGSIIGKMAGDFANIRDMALQSSYSTANFFKKVTELTDQLDNMNYRTKEAGTLVLRFASVLGKSGLDKALQSLFSGFRGEGYLEQMKRNMMAKSDEVKKALRVEAIKFGKAFKESFGGADGEGGMNALLMKQVGAKDEKDLIKKLSQLDNKGRQKLFSDMKAQGGSEEFIDQLYKFVRLSRGTKDKATAAEVQGAQEEMGAGGNLKTKFALIEARVGDRDVNDLGVVAKEALGQFGVGKEQLEVFAQLQTTMKGDLRRSQELAKEAKNRDLTEEEVKFLKGQGLAVENGKLVMLETKEAVNNFSDYLQAQDESKFTELKATEQKTQEQYLDEGVKATTSVFNVLNNTIAGILNTISKGIYSVVQGIFGTALSEDEKKAQREAVNELSQKIENLESQEKRASDKKRALEKQVEADKFKNLDAMKPEERKKFLKESQARIEALEKATQEESRIKKLGDRNRAMLKDIQLNASDYAGVMMDSSKDYMMMRSRHRVLREEKEKTGGKGKVGAFLKGQKDDMKAFKGLGDLTLGDKKYSINSYEDLRKYLADAQRHTSGVDTRVAKVMAEKGLTLKSKRRAEKVKDGRLTYTRNVSDTSLVKGGEEVAGGQHITTDQGGDYTTVRDKEKELTRKALEELKKPVPKAQRDREEQERVKASAQQQEEIQAKAIIEAAKKTKEEEVRAVARALNLKGDATPAQIAKQYAKATEAQKAKLSSLSIGGNETVSRLFGANPSVPAGATKVDPKDGKDILVTDSGEVWKLDRQDQITPMSGGYAMSKPGGAIDQYIGRRMGGGGMNITINIDGSKSPVETGREVVREIRRAQESITGGTR